MWLLLNEGNNWDSGREANLSERSEEEGGRGGETSDSDGGIGEGVIGSWQLTWNEGELRLSTLLAA